MKKKVFSVLIVIALITASFFAGGYVKEQNHSENRLKRCCNLISFAIDKAENESLSDKSTMNALISNVYAAYELCDDAISSGQLHDLWNYLLHTTDNEEGIKQIVLQELNGVLKAFKALDK